MNPRRNNLYDTAIRRMVRESLAEKNRAFAMEYGQKPDGDLLSYLKEEARRLGHTPHPGEILGDELLLSRFGSWQEALTRAGLPMPNTPNKPELFALVREEEQVQKIEYTRKKAEKKRLSAQREAQRRKQIAANRKKHIPDTGEGTM